MKRMLAWIARRALGRCVDPEAHWDAVYRTTSPEEVSWYQTKPEVSLRLIAASGVGKDQGVIDVGGGSSRLVDFLLEAGYVVPTVLDVSAAALEWAKLRLGARASAVDWIEADVTRFIPLRRFGLWHDRAVFHFLTDAADREKYAETLLRTLSPGGQAVIATFAADGPRRCSGLRTMRYDAPAIRAALGPGLFLVEQVDEAHRTPHGTEQKFSYFRFVREGAVP